MSFFKASGICAGLSAVSFLGAIVRGDFMCASNITALLLAAFFLFALAAIVSIIGGFISHIRQRHTAIPD
jgi:hypothetical protein